MNFREAAQTLEAIENFFKETQSSFYGMLSNIPLHINHQNFMEDVRKYVSDDTYLSTLESQYLISLLRLKESYELTLRLSRDLWNEKHPKEK